MINDAASPSEKFSKDAQPFFSVIILFWKGSQYIQKCLNALDRQTFRDFEIILIDNASPEPLPQDLLTSCPDLNIRFFKQNTNLGFAAGNNYGSSLATGQFLALLNSDAFPKPDWLKNVNAAVQTYPDCSFASRLIMAEQPDLLDGEGDVYHVSGLVWHRSYMAPLAQTASPEGEVFSACGAAAIYPKQAFDLVGGFDPDYFAYTEDIDLGFRLRLAGYRCIYLPSAEVFHVGSGSSGPRSREATYYHQRNMVWTFFKNMPSPLFALLVLFHLAVNLLLAINSLAKNLETVYLKAKVDAFKDIDKVWRKRKVVQRHRKVNNLVLLAAMDLNPFSPFLQDRRKVHGRRQ